MNHNEAGAQCALYSPEHLEPWSSDGPTSWDSASNYAGDDFGCFYVAPVAINRDTADALTLSNWSVVTAELEPLCEHDESGIHRFGHWACGWYELMLIHESDTKALKAADDWAASLADYCVADEGALSEQELELEQEAWDSWAASDWRNAVEKRLKALAAPPPDADCYWEDEIIEAVSDEKLSALWAEVSQELNWSVQHESDGPSFNFKSGAELLTLDDLREVTGVRLLAYGQEWRREPYPWLGAAAAPLELEP